MKLFVIRRSTNVMGLLVCCFLLILAFYLEYAEGVQPCLLCMTQRGLLFLLTLIFLIASVHNPQKNKISAIYSLSGLLISLLGIAAASRQLWLQAQPQTSNSVCLPGLKYMLTNFPLSQTLQFVVKGTDSCGKVAWSFLNVSLAGWSLLAFSALVLLLLWQLSRLRRVN